MGALSAGIFEGAGGVISSMGLLQGVEAGSTAAIAEASAIHFIAGAACGAINSALSGGNVGLNALVGGVSAGVSYGAAAELGMMPGTPSGWFSKLNPAEQVVSGIAFHTAVGSLTGGVTAELAGGKFTQGMGQGAWTAAYGFIFNEIADSLDGFPRTIPADANPDTYRPLDQGQAMAEAMNTGNDPLVRNLMIIQALPLVPLTVAVAPEVYMWVLLNPAAVLFGAGFAEGMTPGPTAVPVNLKGYGLGFTTSNILDH